MNIITIALDLLFPQKCFGCGTPQESICGECLEKSRFCSDVNDSEIITLFHYRKKGIRKGIWALKYKGDHTITQIFARELYEALLHELENQILFENFINPLLIPIPLSKKRKRKRGYNQTEKIAREIIRFDKEKLFMLSLDSLERIKDTIPQTSIKNRGKRLHNISGCFSISNQDRVRRKNIILIDDIYTTGATLNEAKKELLKSGARKVMCAAIAH